MSMAPLAGRAALAAVLAARYRRRTTARSRPGRRRTALAGTLAATGPVAAIATARRAGTRFRSPGAAPVRHLLVAVAYATVTAAAEELLWRAPLLRIAGGRRRLATTVLAGSGFVAVHLPRDGWAALPVHALNTASWSAATLIGRRVRWAVVAHTAYDVAAYELRPAEVNR